MPRVGHEEIDSLHPQETQIIVDRFTNLGMMLVLECEALQRRRQKSRSPEAELQLRNLFAIACARGAASTLGPEVART